MSPTLFLEAFGQLTLGTNRAVIAVAEEDLYSVFHSRAELMNWSTTMLPRPPRPRLWEMEEAELTAGRDTPRIGWVQVGLDGGIIKTGRVLPTKVPGFAPLPEHRSHAVDPAEVLPALSQCFDDALRRFGDVTLSGLQVTIRYMEPHYTHADSDLNSGLNWFNLTRQARTEALIAFDHALLGGHTAAVLVASLQRWNTGAFAFGPAVTVPEPYWIQVPASRALMPEGLGVAVTLPEWTASAVAWVLALVIDTARALAPDVRHCAVRMTRVQ